LSPCLPGILRALFPAPPKVPRSPRPEATARSYPKCYPRTASGLSSPGSVLAWPPVVPPASVGCPFRTGPPVPQWALLTTSVARTTPLGLAALAHLPVPQPCGRVGGVVRVGSFVPVCN
jgi:hypothetical protein